MSYIKVKKAMIVIGMLAALLCCFVFSFSYADSSNNNAISTKDAVEISSGALRLLDVLGEESAYSEVYTAICRRTESGESQNEAVANITESMVKSEALFFYAKNKGFTASVSEIEKRIQSQINDVKNADNYDEFARACKENGITVDELIGGDKAYCERVFVTDKMYLQYYDRYHSGMTSLNGRKYSSWESYWHAVEECAIVSYKKSDAYTDLISAINYSVAHLEYADEIIEVRDTSLSLLDGISSKPAEAECSYKTQSNNIENIIKNIKDNTDVFSINDGAYNYETID